MNEADVDSDPHDGADDGADDSADADFSPRQEIHASSGIAKFRRSTAAGAILNGVALGLRDVFDPVVREEAPIMAEAPGEPDSPRRTDAHLDPDDPSQSSVTVRPWLFDGPDETSTDETSTDETSTAATSNADTN